MLSLVKRVFHLHDGSDVILYSARHLEHENVFRGLSLHEVARRLAVLSLDHPAWIDAPAVLGIALAYAHLSGQPFEADLGARSQAGADQTLLRQPTRNLLIMAISLGHRLGLCSGWARPETADLLWAGAAKVLLALDVAHPNDVPPERHHDTPPVTTPTWIIQGARSHPTPHRTAPRRAASRTG